MSFIINPDFIKWDVKPIWSVSIPSEVVGTSPTISPQTIEIFGVNRTVGDIGRDWERIHSVEQFNQGYIAKPSDIRFTLAVKEQGYSFEAMRRIGIGGLLFDVICDLVIDTGTGQTVQNPQTLNNSWLQGPNDQGVIEIGGYERYVGCIVVRESQTIEIGEIPVREFECMALRRAISDGLKELIEGDGTYPEAAAADAIDSFYPPAP